MTTPPELKAVAVAAERNMLAVAILIVLIATLICFYKGLKDKNYAKAKILGMIYIFLNVLRLLLEYFNVF